MRLLVQYKAARGKPVSTVEDSSEPLKGAQMIMGTSRSVSPSAFSQFPRPKRFVSNVLFASLIAMCSWSLSAQVINTVAGGGGGSTSLSPGLITGIAVDQSGNVFLSISDRSVVMRLDATTNSLTTVAGTGTAGYNGDNRAATSAQLNNPLGLAFDSLGTLYIADSGNNRVRKISGGTIATVAGNGTSGHTGDGGAATNASVNSPASVTLDSSSSLYIQEQNPTVGTGGGTVIRKVSNGIITTFATNFITQAYGIVADPSGDIFWVEITYAGFVHELASTGALDTLIAGCLQLSCSSNDGVAATAATMTQPRGIALDSSGNVYYADSGTNRIREVSGGIVTTIAGNGTAGFTGDGGQATSAELNTPSTMAVDVNGNVYIVDSGNQRLRKVSASNAVITTVIGNGATGASGDGGAATAAALSLAPSVAVDSSGNLYIAEAGNQRVRRVSRGIITTVAGDGTQGFSGDSMAATSAQLNTPMGITVDKSGNLYIADTENQRIREVSNGTITTVAGNGTRGYSGDGHAATSAQLQHPIAVAVDSSGSLYIADTGNNAIRKISNGIISTVVGGVFKGFCGDGGAATSAPLNGPSGVAVDGSGNLYIADSADASIRRVSNGIITTVAGSGTNCGTAPRGYSGDSGQATSAQMNYPVSVAVDSAGNLYIADGLNQRIRKVANGVITTVVGTGTAGFSGDGGSAASATLSYPTGIAVDVNGNLYIADTGNQRIRAVSIAPTIGSLGPNSAYAGAAAFTLTVKGTLFQNGSIVEWNGTVLTTTFGSSTQLTSSVPANLLTTVGSANVTVVNAQSAASTASTFSVVAPFGLSSNPTSLTISSPGGRQSAVINIPPAAGFSGVVSLGCTVAYNGQGTATAPPTCSLSPSQVSVTSPTSGSTTLTALTTAPNQAKVLTQPKNWWDRFAGGALAFVAAFILVGLRRRHSSVVVLQAIILVSTLVLIQACGGGGGSGGGRGGGGTTTGNYTITVTATAGSYSTNMGIALAVQ